MTDPLHCGSIHQKVNNCSDLKSKKQCEPSSKRYWMNVNGQTHLCEWNPSRRKGKGQCVYGDPCECASAPFTLNWFGFEAGSPTNCDKLNADQCHYFETSEGRSCVLDILGKCKHPPDTEPICSDINLEDEFATQDDGCPDGNKDDFQTICEKKNSNFTGSARTILEYGCGTFGYGSGRYCMCSYPS
jgi:hypothetical protein